MSDTAKGMIAGLAATIVLSAVMLLKEALGVMPELDIIGMLSRMFSARTSPETPAIGWIMHLLIGVVFWGGLFAWLEPRLPFGPTLNGVVFGIGAWLLMMVLVMPLAGWGLFGVRLGIGALFVALVLHLVFGAVLGAVYGRLKAVR